LIYAIGLYAYAYSVVLRLATRRRLAEQLMQQIDEMPNKVTIAIEIDDSNPNFDDLRSVVLRIRYRGGSKREFDICLKDKDTVMSILKEKIGVITIDGETAGYSREIATRRNGVSSSIL